MTKKKIVVAGASGHIGHVVCGLLADRADVVALVNSEDGALRVKALGINDVHIVDLAKPVNLKALFTLAGAKAAVTAVGNPPLKDEFAGADVFCLITSGDSAEKETNALQAAHDAGIQRVVVLSSETVRLAEELGGKPGPTAAIHGAGEDAAKALFPSCDIVRPTWWSSMHLLPNVGEGLKQGVFMWPGDDTAVAPVHPHDVAEVIAALLLENTSTQRVFELTGPASLKAPEIAAAYTKVLDRPITAPKVTLDEYGDWLVEGAHMPKLAASATAETMRLYAERKGDAPVSDAVFRVTGHQPKSFDDYLAEGIKL